MEGETSASNNGELALARREIAALRAKLAEKDRQLAEFQSEIIRLVSSGDNHLANCEQAYDDLKTVDQMKSDFLALISHELRTPLTAVLGYTDLLLRGIGGPLTPKQEHYLKSASVGARDLLTLINSLIEFSILEAGRDAIHPRKVNLRDAVESSVSPLRSLAAGKGVSLTVDFDANLPEVMADATKFSRALECVLSNAIKFTPCGGSIDLSAKSDGERVVLCVEDSGNGIPAQELERIWEEFYQVDSSPTRRFGGLGLGLAIAKRLIELQGGRIWLESGGPDQGTICKIEISSWRD